MLFDAANKGDEQAVLDLGVGQQVLRASEYIEQSPVQGVAAADRALFNDDDLQLRETAFDIVVLAAEDIDAILSVGPPLKQ